MKGYAERVCFNAWSIELKARAEAIVHAIEDHRYLGEEIRCHELARAVLMLIATEPVRVGRAGSDDLARIADGKCGPIDHSWILIQSQMAPVILDVYTPGRFPMVQLIDPFTCEGLYVEGPERVDINKKVLAMLVIEYRGLR